MLRAGGYGVTSCERATCWLPKLLISGSSPEYLVDMKRLRPLTDSRALAMRPPPRRVTNWVGRSKLAVISRSLRNVASSTYGVSPAWAAACRFTDAAESASRYSVLS